MPAALTCWQTFIDRAELARQSDSRVVEEFNGLRFFTAVSDARAEKGKHLAPRPIGEGVEQAHIVGVVERHPPFVAIQKDAHPLREGSQLQFRPGLRARRALIAVPHPQRPVAGLGAQLDAGTSVYSFQGHAQVPLRFGAHLHLPVVSAGLKALRRQHVDALNETLVVLRVGEDNVTLDCSSFVPGNVDARVRRVHIKRQWGGA